MTHAHRAFLEINGATLYYEIAGAGHPLVMLHGHLLDSGQWDDQVVAFASAYQTVRYEDRLVLLEKVSSPASPLNTKLVTRVVE